MGADSWVNAGAAVVSSAAAVAAWWTSSISRKAKREAENARDAALEQVTAMREIADAARRAFPQPKPHDLRIEHMQGGQFRIRNLGTERATNVILSTPELVENMPPGVLPEWIPTPTWVIREPTTLKPGGWADFHCSAMNPMAGKWQQVTAKSVTVTFDEALEPVELEMPTDLSL